MSKILREAIIKKKQYYITKLISLGVYKSADYTRYQTMTLTELQNEYKGNFPQ